MHTRNYQKYHDHTPMDSKKIFTKQGFTAELQRVKEKMIKTENINDSKKKKMKKIKSLKQSKENKLQKINRQKISQICTTDGPSNISLKNK